MAADTKVISMWQPYTDMSIPHWVYHCWAIHRHEYTTVSLLHAPTGWIKLLFFILFIDIKYMNSQYFLGLSFSFLIHFYSVSLRIQSECRKMHTRITPNAGAFRTVWNVYKFQRMSNKESKTCGLPNGSFGTGWNLKPVLQRGLRFSTVWHLDTIEPC